MVVFKLGGRRHTGLKRSGWWRRMGASSRFGYMRGFFGCFTSSSRRTDLTKEVVVRSKKATTGSVADRASLFAATSPISCIYLLRLGTVSECASALHDHSSNLEDFNHDDVVFKYGLTDDLTRRLKEHTKAFEPWKLSGETNLKLEAFTCVPCDLLYKSEKCLGDAVTLANMRLHHAKHRELAILPVSKLPTLKKLMTSVGAQANMYTRRTKDLIESMDRELFILRSLLNKQNDVVDEEPRNEIPAIFTNRVSEHDRADGVEA